MLVSHDERKDFHPRRPRAGEGKTTFYGTFVHMATGRKAQGHKFGQVWSLLRFIKLQWAGFAWERVF